MWYYRQILKENYPVYEHSSSIIEKNSLLDYLHILLCKKSTNITHYTAFVLCPLATPLIAIVFYFYGLSKIIIYLTSLERNV